MKGRGGLHYAPTGHLRDLEGPIHQVPHRTCERARFSHMRPSAAGEEPSHTRRGPGLRQTPEAGLCARRSRAKKEHLNRLKDCNLKANESQGWNLVSPVLYVPYSLDSGGQDDSPVFWVAVESIIG